MSNITGEERRRFVGASEAASLFSTGLYEAGEKVYATRFELWAQKSGLIDDDFAMTERMEWGNLLERGIAEGCAERFGWTIRYVDRYITHPTVDRMGCSPDFEVVNHPLGPGWLEIKNVDRYIYNSWPLVSETDDEEFCQQVGVPYLAKRREPPLRLQLQVQHQLACAPNRQWAVLAILVGGNELVAIPYPRVPVSIARIEREVPMFWAEVDHEIPPPVDWEADAGTVARLYGYADELKVRNMTSDIETLELAREFRRLGGEIRDREKRRDVLKARMLERIGDAAKVNLPERFSISAPMVDGKEISYWRKPYRYFSVNQRKSKAQRR